MTNSRHCGNCGNKIGPFSRVFIGERKTGKWYFYCFVPTQLTTEDKAKNRKLEDVIKAANLLCYNRRYNVKPDPNQSTAILADIETPAL